MIVDMSRSRRQGISEGQQAPAMCTMAIEGSKGLGMIVSGHLGGIRLAKLPQKPEVTVPYGVPRFGGHFLRGATPCHVM